MSIKYPQINKKSILGDSPKRHLYHYHSLEKLPKQPQRLPNLYEMKQSWAPQPRDTVGTASLPGHMMNGQQKTNQDAIIVDRRLNFFAVADGHGIAGEKVSSFIRLTLPVLLEKSIFDPRDSLTKAIIQTNSELINSKIETVLAGSTLSGVWLKQGKLFSVNVGDSRAVLGRQIGNSWQAIELTKDHKPSREDEAIRILKAGGRIAAQMDLYGNQLGPLRVWLKNLNAPGLAMTRSLGDKLGAQAGVTAVPEIQEFQLSTNDKFIVIATDGVWEYMRSLEVIQLCGQLFERNNSAEQVAQKLVAAAIEAWKRNSLSRDDISCIIIFL